MRRPNHVWDGPRAFVAYGDLVGGFGSAPPGLFWRAAQSRYGVQTSAAMGEACARRSCKLALPDFVAAEGPATATLGPQRLSSMRAA